MRGSYDKDVIKYERRHIRVKKTLSVRLCNPGEWRLHILFETLEPRANQEEDDRGGDG